MGDGCVRPCWQLRAMTRQSFESSVGPSAKSRVPAILTGSCYRLEFGVAQDTAKAFELYKRASANDDTNAIRILGSCYLRGTGFGKDETRVFKLYASAADTTMWLPPETLA
jgi:TPR repeat protein